MNFSVSIRIVLAVTLMHYISSCTVQEDKNVTISSFIPDEDIIKLKFQINKADAYFMKIHKIYNIPKRKLGHIAYLGEKNIYYRNCLDAKGKYIEKRFCNYDSILGINESKQLEATIDTLRSYGIIGSSYSIDRDKFICILESNYKNAGDGRYLFIGSLNESINDSSFTSVLARNESPLFLLLEKKSNMYLLRDKRYNDFISQPNK